MRVIGVFRIAATIWLACFAVACSDSTGTDVHGREKHDADSVIPATDHPQSGERDHDDSHHDDDKGEHHGSDDHDDGHEDVRHSGTHLHGEANLAIAVDGNALVIEFASPVYNLTGFEYAPKDTEGKALVEGVEAVLADPARLFMINRQADCQALESEYAISLGLTDAEALHTEEGHDSEDHESDHSTREGGHHSDSGDTETHSDVLIEYRFRCASPDALNRITVQLFEAFPLIEELEAIFLDQTRQRSATLSPNNINFDIKP